MNDSPAMEPEPDAAPAEFPGFRLDRIEILNWGTFDRQVWIMPLNGRSGLLTGEIGSGKSTLVDAVTALLVPSHKANFNKAAGASAKERTLRSYVLGYYKSERVDGAAARPVAIRTDKEYSVILGVFRNFAHDQSITLAQVFWIKDATGQPERLFAAGECELSIHDDFTGFDADIKELRRRLRKHGVSVFDTYPQYGAWFRRHMGLSEQALELFHQAVSMKTVENLTDFVRTHMLEPFDTAPRIEALLNHMDDLERAHENVLAAQQRQALLESLIDNCNRYDEIELRVAGLTETREALRPYFAEIKCELLKKRIADKTAEYTRKNTIVSQLKDERDAMREQERQLELDIAQNGGNRLNELSREIERTEKERASRKRRSEEYDKTAKAVELLPAESPDVFQSQQECLPQLRADAEDKQNDLQNEEVEIGVDIRTHSTVHDEIKNEIESLRARKSNIDRTQISIRQQLCSALRLDEYDVPFAGELLRVNEAEIHWEGAIERYLRGFGLSLLVPESHYLRVEEWVDKNYLRGRLVYLRVRLTGSRSSAPVHGDSLAAKLDLRSDSPLYNWLESEIARRYGEMICCDTQGRFLQEKYAITLTGQVKNNDRHEKDDRFSLVDRSRYVLGWTNIEKINALESQRIDAERKIQRLADKLSRTQEKRGKAITKSANIRDLMTYHVFQEIDWRSLVGKINELQREKSKLEATSNKLSALQQKLDEMQLKLKEKEFKIGQRTGELGRIEENIETAKKELEGAQKLLNADRLVAQRDILSALIVEVLRERADRLTAEMCGNAEIDVRGELQRRIDNENRSQSHVNEKIVAAIKEYRTAFPLDAREADDSVKSANEFRELLKKLIEDDLPRYERKFKELLNEQTLTEVAQFNGQLKREQNTIKERIDEINLSLRNIDYNIGHYIRLEAQPTENREIRDFQQDLRACTDDALTDSAGDPFSEARFLQVKKIVSRFRGREGSTDEDRKWTALVTDVRNWFTFAACEHSRETDAELDILPDTGGKSGGQKEKLAYTILAASLAYQLGLRGGERQDTAFRFVAIDEAFGRGSDESAQYGLELFRRLGLQLLIATPLQKIHIIEPYVSTLGFVHNEDGRQSRLRILSIEEYKAEKMKDSV